MMKRKRLWIFIVFLILFIVGSFYRYYVVNAQYANYKIETITKNPGDTFVFLGIEHTFSKAEKVETIDRVKNKVTEYHIPFHFKNTTNKKVDLHPEFYRMLRGERLEQTIDYINQETQQNIVSLEANEEITGNAIFSFVQWPTDKNESEKPVFLHIIGSDGVKVEKFSIQVY